MVRFKRAVCNCTANDEVWSAITSLESSWSPLLLGRCKLPGNGGGWGGDKFKPGRGGGFGADEVKWLICCDCVGKPLVELITENNMFYNFKSFGKMDRLGRKNHISLDHKVYKIIMNIIKTSLKIQYYCIMLNYY